MQMNWEKISCSRRHTFNSSPKRGRCSGCKQESATISYPGGTKRLTASMQSCRMSSLPLHWWRSAGAAGASRRLFSGMFFLPLDSLYMWPGEYWWVRWPIVGHPRSFHSWRRLYATTLLFMSRHAPLSVAARCRRSSPKRPPFVCNDTAALSEPCCCSVCGRRRKNY